MGNNQKFACPWVDDVYSTMKDGPIRKIITKQLKRLSQVTTQSSSSIKEQMNKLSIELEAAIEREGILQSLEEMEWDAHNTQKQIFVGTYSEFQEHFLEKIEVQED